MRKVFTAGYSLIVVSLSIETLVVVFQLVHDAPERLPQAASIGVAAALLLAGWGVFIHFNRGVEEIEPEAMARVKREDETVPP